MCVILAYVDRLVYNQAMELDTNRPATLSPASFIAPSTDLGGLAARDRILVTAHQLFYRDGIRATGIDRLIAESGVAKLTFYRHFPSKDDLVRAFLEDRHTRWMAWFVDALGRHGAAGGNGLAPLAATMQEWFEAPAFRGCAFINAVAEIGASLPGALKISQRHKAEMTQVIAGLLTDGAAQRARAEAAAVAVDGAIIQAQLNGAAGAGKNLAMLLRALEEARAH
jgi:AcrR family transcriptional regulator